MNAPLQSVGEVVPISPYFDLTADLFDRFDRLAHVMASATVLPEHFRGKPGNCFALITQSHRWRMDPFAVASKTHITQGGALGYEAQLISAVVTTLAPVTGRPTYEYIGDWSKVLGKVDERKSEKSGGKYYVATYTQKDEEGLGVIVRATIIGESAPREVTVMMAQAWPRFSTQWATDPQQQIGYLAIRKWARRYTPDVLLGVYTPEEHRAGEVMRDMGVAEEVSRGPTEASGPASRTDEIKQRMKRTQPPKLADVLRAIRDADGAAALTGAGEMATRLANDADKETARRAYAEKLQASKKAKPANATAEAPATTETATNHSAVTFAVVADGLNTAKDMDALNLAADMIRSVADEAQRVELSQLYSVRAAEFDAAQS
ncbi:RecT family recombinase [Paraburkholderia dipogonis]|uniref:RecT family recombinase n=1 Tax=Paraburkholderia dipogonis TaxID=1211383 RepID=UPI0038BC6B5A